MTRLSINIAAFDKSASPMKKSYDVREFTNEQLLEAEKHQKKVRKMKATTLFTVVVVAAVVVVVLV